MPAAAAFHAPHARVTELCDIFASQEAGGILTTTPFIDVFNCMRRTDEQSFGGGVLSLWTQKRMIAGKSLGKKASA